MAQTLRVAIIGDARSYQRSLQTAGMATTGFGSKLSRLGAIAGITAGGTGIAALTIALRAGIDEWTQGQKVAAQTAQVLKTTGGVANVTAKEVSNLAQAIMKKTGIDDEAIQTTENLLLGFTNIRNELGKGNDIFTRATKIVTDYSVRTGRSAVGASIMFGKALQDPLKNMGALSRAVGGLSTAQKAQIKTMVESGNLIGAQNLLLTELEKRYGGAAEAAGKTLPGQLDILRERFRNLAGQGVGVAIAKLQEMAPTILGIIGTVGHFMDVLRPLASLMFDVFVTPMKAISALLRGDWSAAWDAAKKPVEDLIAVAQGVWAHIQGPISQLGEIAKMVGGFFEDAVQAVTDTIGDAINAATEFGRSIYDGVVSGITGVAEWVQGRVLAAVGFITAQLGAALTAATTFGANILNGLKAGILGFAEWVISRLVLAMSAITSRLGAALTAATTFGRNILNGLKAGITGFEGWVLGRVNAGIAAISGHVGGALGAATSFGRAALNGMKAGILGFEKWVLDRVNAAVDIFRDLAGKAGGAARALGAAIYNGFKSGLSPIFGFVSSVVSAIQSAINLAASIGASIHAGGDFNAAAAAAHAQGRAIGGPVRKGSPYVVGEHGPELFVPKASGRIVPNGRMGAAGGGGGNVYVTVQGALLGTSVPEVTETIRRELYRTKGRNGSLDF